VPIFVESIEQAKRDAAAAIQAGADLIELRLDLLSESEFARRILSDFGTPFVLTCRPIAEGGQSDLPDDPRVDFLSEIAPMDETITLDIESATLRRAAGQAITNRLIISAHYFDGRPERLYNLIDELNHSPSSVNKIAWLARTIRDNIEAFEILQHRQKPTIALCMGEAGLISRVLAKKFGAFLTFASLRDESATAPGQITIHEMKSLYRWDAIQPSTKVYGVVASPVKHSLSPAIHNAAFDQTGFDGIYLPMLVNPGYESFKAFMESFTAFAALDLCGLSITLPHKENALKYLQEKQAQIEPLALRIGAVNTILIERSLAPSPNTLGEGRGEGLLLRGLNTDYAAILDSITNALNISRNDLANFRVAVIGAGGTGRTAVAALASCGSTVVVYNRTKERADALAQEFNGKTGQVVSACLEKLCNSCCHIYINTTSVGMSPHIDQSPFGERLPEFTSDTLVFDTIYNPPKTKLLQQAAQAGARTINGVEMFVRQAAAQFQAWTNLPAPMDVMRRVIEGRLANSGK
jgi:3-dehydroquinate dehydratase/shikimate dehydrogenase